MFIDILSDLHLDFYFSADTTTEIDAVKSIFDPIFFDNRKRDTGDVLVIAGDIGHYNHQNIEVLKIFKQEYYKYIVCVLGNHDYYLINDTQKKKYKSNSFNRVKEMRELINSEENMYCLDGTLVEIEGVVFGGFDSWYSGSYMINKYPQRPLDYSRFSIDSIWKSFNNDSRYIYGVEYFDDIYNIELPKIENIYKKCDVFISHVNPSCKDEHISKSFRNQDSNTFFTFNGEKYMILGSMKYWIFGHSHYEIKYDQHGVRCVCNPFGYPFESSYGDDVWIRSIEVYPK